jgi:hypothetical protein
VPAHSTRATIEEAVQSGFQRKPDGKRSDGWWIATEVEIWLETGVVDCRLQDIVGWGLEHWTNTHRHSVQF